MYRTFLIALMLSKIALHAQPALQWQKCYGGSAMDIPKSMITTFDGGYVIFGTSASTDGDVSGNHGATDWWILKINTTGDKLWQRTLGGDWHETLCAVKQTPDEGFILVGYTQSDNGNVSGNHGDYDYWLVKLSKTGAVEWQKTYGGGDNDEAYSIALCPDGGYLLAGHSTSKDGDRSSHLGGADIWLVKTDASGKMLWEQSYGGSKADLAYSIYPVKDGGYIITGGTWSNDGDVTGNHGNIDCWVLKIDSLGHKMWQKTLGGTALDLGTDIIQSKNGAYILTVQTQSNDGDVCGSHGLFDYWVVNLAPSGGVNWAKTFGGSQNDSPQSICEDRDGNLLIAGASASSDGDVQENKGLSDAWFVQIDQSGQLIWQQNLGGANLDNGVQAITTGDGSYLFSVLTYSSDGDVQGNHGAIDFWMVKIKETSSWAEEQPSNRLIIFPNPAQNTIDLQFPNHFTLIQASVFDASGVEVFSHTGHLPQARLNVSALPSGHYWVKAIGEGQVVISGEFVKR